jgi:predicted metalloendopeptidase
MPVENRHRRSTAVTDMTIGEETCMHATQHMLPGHVALAYIESRGAADMERVRQGVTVITQNIVRRFGQLIEKQAPWMTAQDRERALHKLRAIVIRVGHPNDPEWSSSESYARSMRADQYLLNLNQVQAFRVSQNLRDWRAGAVLYYANKSDALDTTAATRARDSLAKFGVPLSMVNAFYDPSSNTITVPLGILQAPFYDLRYDDVSAYAAIGSVIGHELAHAFDVQGILFDSHGAFHAQGFWSASGMAAYKQQAACVAETYATASGITSVMDTCRALYVRDHEPAYAERTLGEDMADLIGTRLAYEALFLPAGTDGAKWEMTEERKAKSHAFFYTYAQMWCAISNQANECERLLHDVHAVPKMRVDHTLRHLEYFAQAFHCPAPNEQCRVF